MQVPCISAHAVIVSVVPPLKERPGKLPLSRLRIFLATCTAFETAAILDSCRFVPSTRKHGQTDRYGGSTVTGLIENWLAGAFSLHSCGP
jgi:hypothetical protein